MDNDGNMTTGYTPEGYALTMTYDAQNRMKTSSYNDGTSHLFQYSYAGNSLLSGMIKDGNTTKYLRSGFLPIQERDGSNAITREYTWGKNLGGGIGGLLNLKQGGQDYSYLYDGKGNVSALIDNTQAVVASYAYDPFGKLMKQSGTLDQPYTFSTKEAQPGTGQYYYGYRFYDSCSGKWTTRDPLGEYADMNVYRAVQNNAVNFIDPLGLDSYMCEKPLDYLSEHGWENLGTKSGWDFSWNPLYHKYICVKQGGEIICGGQSGGGKLYGSGQQSNDHFVAYRCKKADSNNCIDNCLKRKILEKKRPFYGLKGPGTNCQEWANNSYVACQEECRNDESSLEWGIAP
jgi:RHS repeat-associated protein